MKKWEYKADSSIRLDIALQQRLPNLSRSHIRKLLDNGKILVNNQRYKAGYMLKNNDLVLIDFEESDERIDDINIPIIYEDNDCLVINKPVGVLSHSKGSYNPEATVATYIADKTDGLEGERAGIVHRLDRATSGVMICAKNQESQKWLQKQFAQRKVKKTYVAVIKAGLKPKQARIDMPIERDPRSPKQFRVGVNGKEAQTNYEVAESNNLHSTIVLKPETGRTHQLRVHLKQLGYPIVGDILYGGEEYSRLMLHAKELELTLPNRHRQVFKAPLPSEFKDIMDL